MLQQVDTTATNRFTSWNFFPPRYHDTSTIDTLMGWARNRTTFWVSWFQFCPVKIENKVTPVWGLTHQQPNCHEPVLPVGITGDILTQCVCVCDCVLPQPAVPPGTGNPLMGSKGLGRRWRRWRGSWLARAQVNPLIGSKGRRVARLWWPPGGSV